MALHVGHSSMSGCVLLKEGRGSNAQLYTYIWHIKGEDFPQDNFIQNRDRISVNVMHISVFDLFSNILPACMAMNPKVFETRDQHTI